MTQNTEPRAIQDYLKDFANRGVPQQAVSKGFVQAFDVCETHGKYPANSQAEDGKVRWNQPGCPTCRKNVQTQALVANADIGRRFMNCTFDNYQTESQPQEFALKNCREYAENFKNELDAGRCLVLRGNPGTGKNHLATAIMLNVLSQGYTALRIKASVYLDEYWSKDFGEREAWMQRMANVDLLVIDEIGRASNGKSANDAFFRLIDSRYEAMKPIIAISNLSRDELVETLGDAAYDRLSEGGGCRINFNWTSERAIRK